MGQIISEIVDHHQFFAYKPMYGQALITALARLTGRVISIIANQPNRYAGAAGPKECDKAVDRGKNKLPT
ncbi:carboxyl transferase domain-containing protein [Bacillus songklensis]|uniref:Carboxyl transferase domain-containing protein n=1 Tax=Bacillus songklensis TaxID=1069116 RepID=A0ABV8B7A3_9BACI